MGLPPWQPEQFYERYVKILLYARKQVKLPAEFCSEDFLGWWNQGWFDKHGMYYGRDNKYIDRSEYVGVGDRFVLELIFKKFVYITNLMRICFI
jgi:hypothetical protein